MLLYKNNLANAAHNYHHIYPNYIWIEESLRLLFWQCYRA